MIVTSHLTFTLNLTTVQTCEYSDQLLLHLNQLCASCLASLLLLFLCLLMTKSHSSSCEANSNFNSTNLPESSSIELTEADC